MRYNKIRSLKFFSSGKNGRTFLSAPCYWFYTHTVSSIKCLQAIIHLFGILNDPYQSNFGRQTKHYQVQAAVETAQSLRVHRQSYGTKHIPNEMVTAIQTGLRILVHQLEDSEEIRQAFVEFCRFGTALGHRFKQTADTIHEIKKSALRQGIQLPAEAIAIFDGSEQWNGLES